tara:strand:+ start:9374 stop:9886 length:513 start_codon:yes stop_codon:yes gene_type:complete
MKVIITIIISLITVSIAEVKVGWIELSTVVTQLDDFRQAQAELEDQSRKWQTEIQDMEVKLDSMLQAYQKNQILMNDERRQQTEMEITQYQQSIQTFYMQKMGPEGELARLNAQKMNPIIQKVYAAVDKVAFQENYDYVMDSEQAGLIYKKEENNLNALVLKQLKDEPTQ